MKYYVGLDVSLKETAICVVDQVGDIIGEKSVVTEPKVIYDFLAKTKLTFTKVGLEAGGLTPWLYRELASLGLDMVCIETRHAKATLQAQRVKTDRNDARGLAHIMRTGWYKAVHVKTDESQKLRVLMNNRRCLLDKRLDIENQIRGTLKVFGLKIGTTSKTRYDIRVTELIDSQRELQLYLEPMLKVRGELLAQESKLDSMIRKIVKDDEVCRRLMTIPGVGPLTALAFRTTIDDPYRFKKSRDVAVHLGLTPRKYASGEIDYNGRISKCGDPMARAHLFEAAKVMMSRVTKWSALKAWGMRIARRSSMKNACVAVARKLSTIMHRMWLDGTTFEWGSMPQVTKA
jgi:transposase